MWPHLGTGSTFTSSGVLWGLLQPSGPELVSAQVHFTAGPVRAEQSSAAEGTLCGQVWVQRQCSGCEVDGGVWPVPRTDGGFPGARRNFVS